MKKTIYTFLLFLIFPIALQAQEYQLGAGDLVSISVHQYPDMKTQARIGEGGTINYPLIGAINIGGMSANEAGLLIEKALKNGNFIKSPQVRVFVEDFRSQSVSILGKIDKPGKYPVIGNSTIMDIIAEAGGIVKDGNTRVTITRKGQKPFAVDTSLVHQGDLENNVDVKPGDIIYVPRMDVFYIYGEVRKPGEYQLQSGMTILQALSIGGGLTDKATERGLKIKRKNSDGEVKTINADVTETLKPDDVVYVKESLF